MQSSLETTKVLAELLAWRATTPMISAHTLRMTIKDARRSGTVVGQFQAGITGLPPCMGIAKVCPRDMQA